MLTHVTFQLHGYILGINLLRQRISKIICETELTNHISIHLHLTSYVIIGRQFKYDALLTEAGIKSVRSAVKVKRFADNEAALSQTALRVMDVCQKTMLLWFGEMQHHAWLSVCTHICPCTTLEEQRFKHVFHRKKVKTTTTKLRGASKTRIK